MSGIHANVVRLSAPLPTRITGTWCGNVRIEAADSVEAEAQAAVARYPSIREAYEAVLAKRAQYHEQDSMWQYWDDVSRAI